MKVMRCVEQDVANFNIGDIINFTLVDGEEVQAMAMKKLDDGILFCFVDCLTESLFMNEKNVNTGGYFYSKVRAVLNSEIFSKFPDEIKSRLVKFENGDYLRIPTEEEILGKNKYGEIETDDVEQWEPMNIRKNRIASHGKNGDYERYWVQNKWVGHPDAFCCIDNDGFVHGRCAALTCGVRPVFILNQESYPCTEQNYLLGAYNEIKQKYLLETCSDIPLDTKLLVNGKVVYVHIDYNHN